MRAPDRVRVRAPATIGNFGPGFDACALAVRGLGDVVELARAPRDSIRLLGPHAPGIPPAWDRNVAGAVLDALRARTGVRQRFLVRIRKGMPAGSGLGSSASSAGGAALAFHAMYGRAHGLGPEDLVRAAGEGEALVSGRHYDDVASVVLGGLAIVQARPRGLALARVAPPRRLHLALLRPHARLDTHAMRKLVPAKVRRGDAVWNLGSVALLVDAMHRGDVRAVGACLEDRIAAPARSRRVPGYQAIVGAAVRAGAAGAALSGSGPAVFAVADSRAGAERAARAMARAARRQGLAATAHVARPEREVMHRAVALP